jgi:membrane fusion protein (multidrug efflux system)
VLYEIDPATYQAAFDSANANRQKAEAAVPNAQAKVERYQGLLKQNAVSKQELDDAIASLAQAKADVAAAEAAVETARINLAYTKVTAPISGRIGASAYTVGALVTADQTTALTTIRALDPINVDVTQSSTNLLKFREALKEGRMKITGGQVNVKLKLETGATYGATGRMEFAEANVDQTTGTFALRAVFPNPDHLLMPGMYVRATVEEGIAENSFLIPQRAVARTPQGQPTARFVTAEGKLEDRVLSVQRAVGNTWLIDKGVADGDRVIVEGGMMARAGMEVGTREVTVDDATGEIRPVNQGQIEGGTVVANGDAKPGESPSKTGQN